MLLCVEEIKKCDISIYTLDVEPLYYSFMFEKEKKSHKCKKLDFYFFTLLALQLTQNRISKSRELKSLSHFLFLHFFFSF